MRGNKKVSFIVALTIITLLIASTPLIYAAEVPTHAYISVSPNPVGLNQPASVTMWLDKIPPIGFDFAPLELWDFTLKITDPNGGVETLDFESDPIASAYYGFTPDKLGTYTFQMTMHEEEFGGTTYLSSVSNTVELVVQSEWVEEWSAAELPTGYWERPIDAQNREWSSIASYWLGIPGAYMPMWTSTFSSMGKINPYTTGPKTSHIVWTKEIAFGGLVGGQYGSLGYYTGDSYELKSFPAIIMNGVFYRNLPKTNDAYGGQFVAIDLQTGEELWRNDGSIIFGQLLDYESLNQHGVIPYLWSDSYQMYDAFTGELLLTFTNAIGGGPFTTFSYDNKGNILAYILDTNADTVTIWNSTQAILYGRPANAPGGFGAGNPDYWRPAYNADPYNWTAGIMCTTKVPDTGAAQSIIKINSEDGVIIARANIAATDTEAAKVLEVGYSTKDGHQIWQKTRTGEDALVGASTPFSCTVGSGVYCIFGQEAMQWHCYNIMTGEEKWVSDPYTDAWGSFFTTIGDGCAYIAYDRLYATAYDGKLHCYDITDGSHLWDSSVGSSGLETTYGTWPLWGSMLIADHKVYAGTGEHSPNQPIPRGEKFVCFDADTGDIIWEVSGFMMNPIIADGYIVTFNSYDMQNYCFGKGLTETTVTAPDFAVSAGTEVLIQGTVTDQSPGAPGTPAISDEHMSEWMEYLYMDQPKPTDASGVPVQIKAYAESVAEINVGTVYSDINGNYACNWAPENDGLYKIVATFAGSDAYFGSEAETGLIVSGSGVGSGSSLSAFEVVMIVALVVIAVLVVYAIYAVKKQK
jgi:hypothetical protein